LDAKTPSSVTCAKIDVMATVYFNLKKQGAIERESDFNSKSVKISGERKVTSPTKRGSVGNNWSSQ
jgi:hypothetical protein